MILNISVVLYYILDANWSKVKNGVVQKYSNLKFIAKHFMYTWYMYIVYNMSTRVHEGLFFCEQV